jgi:hypothetical protein
MHRVLIVVCTVAATSCSLGTSPQPAQQTGTPSKPATQAATQPVAVSSQPAPANAIASGQYSADGDLRCDLLEVKRLSGGALIIKWRIVNAAAAQTPGLTATQPKTIDYTGHWADLYFIDPAENKKYAYLTDAGNQGIVDVFWGQLPAGQQRASWAKFPAPPPASNKIAIHIPSFPPFEDVPVSQ